MNSTNCPNCGGKLRAESIGWKCEKCHGFIDMKDNFHPHIERPFLPPMTNADKIRAMNDEELAAFMCSLAYARNTPWSDPFCRTFCDNCPTVEGKIEETGQTMEFNECDFVDGKCPHGDDVIWWLRQPAEVVAE